MSRDFVGAAGVFLSLRGLVAGAVPAAAEPDGIVLSQFPILRLTGLRSCSTSLIANTGLLVALSRLLRGGADGLALGWGFTRGLAAVVALWLILSELGLLFSAGDPPHKGAVMDGIFATAVGALAWLGALLGLLWVARDRR